jgi:lyso-ornithine lipid O-acyltransferase
MAEVDVGRAPVRVLGARFDVGGADVPAAARATGRAMGLAATIGAMLVQTRAQFAVDRAMAESPSAYAERTSTCARSILARHGVVVVPNGPRVRGPALLVANHASYLDPLVVASVVPCIAVAKGETRGWPLVGEGMQALGVIFVRRGDPYSGAIALRRALRALVGGASVLNFPEGTTTDGRSVDPFRHGVFGLASIAGVPIVPVTVVYDDPGIAWYGGEAFLPHYMRMARTRSVVAQVHLGEPIVARPSDGPYALAARARGVVADRLARAFRD